MVKNDFHVSPDVFNYIQVRTFDMAKKVPRCPFALNNSW